MNGVLVLAGGRSQRIGNHKCFLKLEGKALIAHVVSKAQQIADEVVVVTGKNYDISQYSSILPKTATIVKDAFDGEGPLVGIISGMKKMRSKYVAIVPCDSPFIKNEVYKLLFEKVHGSDAAIPMWPNGYIEPLHSVYMTNSAVSAGEETLDHGELSIRDMIKRLQQVVTVPIREIKGFDPQLLTFFNVNTLKDFETAERVMRSISLETHKK
jgi:molybdopterin-guanine dinucleotide biosynthesis protein A